MPATFVPPSGISWAHPPSSPRPACRLVLGEVHDLRPDPTTMGETSGRFIHPESPERWVRHAVETLSQDGRLRFASAGDAPTLSLNVDLLQAYMSSWSTAKHAVVMLRVRYAADGAVAKEQAFRGEVSGMLWTDSESEVLGALNEALKRAVAAMDDDLVLRCSG